MIGAGRLGASLALALRAQGASLVGFTAGSPEGSARAKVWLGSQASTDLADLVSHSPDLYVVAVPDQVLPEVAAKLAGQLERAAWAHGKAPVVMHTSGATSVTVLSACEQAGAVTLAFHPLQTFSEPLTGSTRFAGAAIAVTPPTPHPDSPGATFGFRLAGLLGARPFLLPDDKRSLYHAAAAFACNYLVTLEYHAERLFIDAGLPEEAALALFLPLVRATLDNVAAQGTVAALTGPLSRGDTGTVAGHVDALRTHAPDLLPVYRALGLATLDLLRDRGEIDPEAIDELGFLLGAIDQPSAQPLSTERT